MKKILFVSICLVLFFSFLPSRPIYAGDKSHQVMGHSINAIHEYDKSNPANSMLVNPDGFDIIDKAESADGQTVYVVTGSNGHRIYKSTDAGTTWRPLMAPSAINPANLIAISPENANIVAVLGGANNPSVYISTNGGFIFTDMGIIANSGSNIIAATDLAISPQVVFNNSVTVYVAVSGADNIFQGNVWLYNLYSATPGWLSTKSMAGFATCSSVDAIAFSPNFQSDMVMVAVSSNIAADKVKFQFLVVVARNWNSFILPQYPVTIVTSSLMTGVYEASITLDPQYLGSDETRHKAVVELFLVGDTANSGVYQLDDINVFKIVDGPNPHPTLTGYDVSPGFASPGSTIIFTYTIDNPSLISQNIGLGASIRGPDGKYWDNAYNDIVVSVAPGISTKSRSFLIDISLPEGLYDVYWSLWSGTPGASTQYPGQDRQDYLTVKPIRDGFIIPLEKRIFPPGIVYDLDMFAVNKGSPAKFRMEADAPPGWSIYGRNTLGNSVYTQMESGHVGRFEFSVKAPAQGGSGTITWKLFCSNELLDTEQTYATTIPDFLPVVIGRMPPGEATYDKNNKYEGGYALSQGALSVKYLGHADYAIVQLGEVIAGTGLGARASWIVQANDQQVVRYSLRLTPDPLARQAPTRDGAGVIQIVFDNEELECIKNTSGVYIGNRGKIIDIDETNINDQGVRGLIAIWLESIDLKEQVWVVVDFKRKTDNDEYKHPSDIEALKREYDREGIVENQDDIYKECADIFGEFSLTTASNITDFLKLGKAWPQGTSFSELADEATNSLKDLKTLWDYFVNIQHGLISETRAYGAILKFFLTFVEEAWKSQTFELPAVYVIYPTDPVTMQDADVNDDSIVNETDSDAIIKALDTQRNESGFDDAADLNGDGFINIFDLAIMGANLSD